MNEYDKPVCQRIKKLVIEADSYLNLLYTTPYIYTRNAILNGLRYRLSEIAFLSNMICSKNVPLKEAFVPIVQQNQRNFTLQELEKYNGKDGNPAYVAVNGVVYDVTDNGAWAAATHFGLTAGKDLTNEFASCHAGQAILSKLKLIGKLIS